MTAPELVEVTRRDRFSVDAMSEGDWLVRGTDDPSRALELIVAQLDEDPYGYDQLAGVTPDWSTETGLGPDLDAVAAMADWCHDMLTHARPGWYRKVHCLPSSGGAWEGWSWQLGYAKGPGRGVFRGVYFQP